MAQRDEKAERLATALRENLRRRKAQARELSQTTDEIVPFVSSEVEKRVSEGFSTSLETNEKK